jgi:hypothetical protein
MQYEQRYRIIKTDGSVIEGTYIQTKGNDEDYPTFVLVSWGPTTDPDAPGYIVSVEPVNGE